MLFRKMISQWAATIYTGAVSFGLSVLIARSIGPASFGKYAVALAAGAMLSIVLDGGFRTLLMRESARQSASSRFTLPLLPRLAFGHALAAAVVMLVLAGVFFQAYLSLALATIACFLGVVLSQYVSALLRGEGRFEADAGWQVAQRSLSALFIVAVVFAGLDRPWQILSAWSAGSILACVLAPYGIRYWPRLSWDGALYRMALPLLWINLATTIYFRFDMLALKYLGIADGQIGQYAAAYRLIEAVILVTSPVSIIWFRKIRLMAPGHEKNRAVWRTTVMAAVFGMLCALAIDGLASPIVHFAYGSHYPGSVGLLSVLAWAVVFLLPNAVLTQAALAMELERPYALAATLAAGFNVLFNLVMIRHMGTMAAAWATIYTEILLMVILAWAIYRQSGSMRHGRDANECEKSQLP